MTYIYIRIPTWFSTFHNLHISFVLFQILFLAGYVDLAAVDFFPQRISKNTRLHSIKLEELFVAVCLTKQVIFLFAVYSWEDIQVLQMHSLLEIILWIS